MLTFKFIRLYLLTCVLFQLKEVITYIREDGLTLNVQSYVAILECLGRVYINSTRSKFVRYYCTMMTTQGISYDEVMNKADFVSDQREVILSVIRKVHPDYIPTYQHPDVQYTCGLLENLNCPEQLIPMNKNREDTELYKRLFTGDQLKEFTRKQLEIEMDGYVKVCPSLKLLNI